MFARLFSIVFLTALLLTPSLVLAQDAKTEICKGSTGNTGSVISTEDGRGNTTPAHCAGGGKTLEGYFGSIANVLIFIVGAISVIVLIIGGLTYVTSTGDPARIKRAKDTILYAVIGIIVAILAYAIVNFVVDRIK